MNFFLVTASKSPNVWRRRRRHFVYRIFTENVNPNDIRSILDAHFQGYTTYEGQGTWKGRSESTLLIEIDGANPKKVRAVADEIKRLNSQESVLIQRNRTESILT